MRIIAFLIFISLLSCRPPSQTRKIDLAANSIVEIQRPNGKGDFQSHGTGFLIERRNAPHGYAFVVSNEHVLSLTAVEVVIKANSAFLDQTSIQPNDSFNLGGYVWRLDEGVFRCTVRLEAGLTYLSHDSLDIAVLPIRIPSEFLNNNQGRRTLLRMSDAEPISQNKIVYRKDVQLGELVYFLGFPNGIGTLEGQLYSTSEGLVPANSYTENAPNPVARFGAVAWIAKDAKRYLVDALSYSGNSGSPVFYAKSSKHAKLELIGLVFGHEGDTTSVIQEHGKRPRLIHSGNMGLLKAHFADDILNLVREAEKLPLDAQ